MSALVRCQDKLNGLGSSPYWSCYRLVDRVAHSWENMLQVRMALKQGTDSFPVYIEGALLTFSFWPSDTNFGLLDSRTVKE